MNKKTTQRHAEEGKGIMKDAPKIAWKQLTVRIPEDVHRAMKIRAVEEGRPVAVMVEGLIRQYLAEGKRA